MLYPALLLYGLYIVVDRSFWMGQRRGLPTFTCTGIYCGRGRCSVWW